MPADPTTAPVFTVVNTGEPTDAAISALARLLLAVVDAEETTPRNDETGHDANHAGRVKTEEIKQDAIYHNETTEQTARKARTRS